MTWTAPRTWVAGETVTAALMNTHVRDNLKAIGDPWTAYVPVFTNLTVGNATVAGRYMQAGKMVNFVVNVIMGSTTVFGANWIMTLPAALLSGYEYRFSIGMKDVSAAANYLGLTYATSGSSVSLAAGGGASGILTAGLSSTVPFTWAVSDILTVMGTYESA